MDGTWKAVVTVLATTCANVVTGGSGKGFESVLVSASEAETNVATFVTTILIGVSVLLSRKFIQFHTDKLDASKMLAEFDKFKIQLWFNLI